MTSETRPACGSITIHRVTETLQDGRVAEYAFGTLNGFDDTAFYARPASEPANAAALESLTAFCTSGTR